MRVRKCMVFSWSFATKSELSAISSIAWSQHVVQMTKTQSTRMHSACATFRAWATTDGGRELEKRYGRERWRRRATSSLGPVVYPPTYTHSHVHKTVVAVMLCWWNRHGLMQQIVLQKVHGAWNGWCAAITCSSSKGFAQSVVYDIHSSLHTQVLFSSPTNTWDMHTVHSKQLWQEPCWVLQLVTNLPVCPMMPAAWHSSTRVIASYFSARSQISLIHRGRHARSH